MMSEGKSQLYILIGAGLTIAVFVVDLTLPLGVAGAVPYVAVVLLTLGLANSRPTLIAGIACSFLTVLGYFFSTEMGVSWMVLTNRFLALFGIWVAVFFVLSYKAHMRKFQENEVRFRTLFNAANESIIAVDPKGLITMANPITQDLFGHKVEDLYGKSIEILIPQRFHNSHVQDRKSYMENPQNRSMGKNLDLYGVRKDGSEFPVEISLSHFKQKGKVFAIAFIVDITERKKMQVQLEQFNKDLEDRIKARTKELDKAISALEYSNNELQDEIRIRREAEKLAKQALVKEKELNELKSRFVSMASHEFRTPLSTILSSVSLISKYVEPSDQEKRDKHINRVKSSVNNLTAILNDFLSLDKLEEGIVENNPVAINLVDFAKEVVEEMQVMAKPGQKIYHIHKGSADANLDQQLLKNILINLLSNAIKYSPEDSKIDFVTESNNSQIDIFIKDQGIGIPKEDQEHMTERFFRAKNVSNIGGTGLGLNIVTKYVELMGGSMEFESEENQGSTFKVTIPQKS